MKCKKRGGKDGRVKERTMSAKQDKGCRTSSQRGERKQKREKGPLRKFASKTAPGQVCKGKAPHAKQMARCSIRWIELHSL